MTLIPIERVNQVGGDGGNCIEERLILLREVLGENGDGVIKDKSFLMTKK